MAYSNYYAASGLFHGSMSSVMGTQFDILMVGSDPRLLGTVWEKVESEVQRLDKMLNRFDPESEVSFVNREAGHYPVTVGEELWNILLNCKRYNELTEGYFDITLQGFDQVLLTEEDKSIFFFSESLHIDLGGYGKGYALAKIRELLEENGRRLSISEIVRFWRSVRIRAANIGRWVLTIRLRKSGLPI